MLQFDDPEWFRRLGDVARSIGTERFHQTLTDLFGAIMRHDASWIIRYSRAAPPDVIYTRNVPAETLAIYNTKCLDVDPFSQHWKKGGNPGVLTLSQLTSNNIESLVYKKLFLMTASVTDEIGMLFSTIGHCCLGLFLDRESGHFSKSDIQRANRIFPTLEGFHRAHLGWLFNNLRNRDLNGIQDFINRPVFIQDRFGMEVYSNESWNRAVAADGAIMDAVAALFAEISPQARRVRDFVLRSEVFDRDFPLAPAGQMFVLQPCDATQEDNRTGRIGGVLQLFTPREGQVLSLIMQGWNTGQIAQHLEISKGAIRNLRLRIHRKAEVASERELIKKFTPVFG